MIRPGRRLGMASLLLRSAGGARRLLHVLGGPGSDAELPSIDRQPRPALTSHSPKHGRPRCNITTAGFPSDTPLSVPSGKRTPLRKRRRVLRTRSGRSDSTSSLDRRQPSQPRSRERKPRSGEVGRAGESGTPDRRSRGADRRSPAHAILLGREPQVRLALTLSRQRRPGLRVLRAEAAAAAAEALRRVDCRASPPSGARLPAAQ